VGRPVRRQQFAPRVLAGAVLCVAVFSGCAHRAPASIHDGMTVISGHNTAHSSLHDAVETVLVEAAAITVDHGYRYFRVMTQIRPGADVTIHVYGAGEVDRRASDVYDADDIAAGRMQPIG